MKVKNKETGEVYEAIKSVSYMHADDPSHGTFECAVDVLEDEIDWEQRRYEIAKECVARCCSPCETKFRGSEKVYAELSVRFADALINELKKK